MGLCVISAMYYKKLYFYNVTLIVLSLETFNRYDKNYIKTLSHFGKGRDVAASIMLGKTETHPCQFAGKYTRDYNRKVRLKRRRACRGAV